MSALSRTRRSACAFAGVVLAAALLRAPVSSALVTRGDDAAQAGDIAAAQRAYRRALWLDRSNAVAADRLAFPLATGKTKQSYLEAVALATATMQRSGSTPSLLADRAFAELRLGRLMAARADFRRAAEGGDLRYSYAAGRLSYRLGEGVAARRDALAAGPIKPARGRRAVPR